MFKTSNRGIGKKKKKGFNPKKPNKINMDWREYASSISLWGVTVCNKGINSREMYYVLVRVISNIINGIVTHSLTLRVLVT